MRILLYIVILHEFYIVHSNLNESKGCTFGKQHDLDGVVSFERIYLAEAIGSKFQTFSSDFESSIDVEIQKTLINNLNPEQKNPKSVSSLKSVLEKFPHFSIDFLKSFFPMDELKVWQKWALQLKPLHKKVTDNEGERDRLVRNVHSSFNATFEGFKRNQTLLMGMFPFIKRNLESLKNKIDKIVNRDKCRTEKRPHQTNETLETKADNEDSEDNEEIPRDCFESFSRGRRRSGVTVIRPHPTVAPMHVWCNHTVEGGGWTVVLRRERQKIQLDFRRPFEEYESGFGNIEGEHWLGLSALHHMTSRRPNELMVLLSIPGEEAFSRYSKFRVGEGEGYKLHVSGFNESSTGGNGLFYHNKMLFSTFDRDRDLDPVGSCSVHSGGGGFWFNFCYHANPTGIYPPRGLPNDTALHSLLEWRRWKGFYTFLSRLVMMVRPRGVGNLPKKGSRRH